ncbi:hypothetical protein F9L33_10120 [Amylibacter sp. SFDW26]|uniref:hypothetical protein n=1 Tax=Amylibacter sp. SFDW26 TaxID=2652722 RepID=UPI001261EDC0|nr:hypothetical protein [Amylibacter sp. SFDW26]KAB7613721.1 hypothetical protein F9L33_10120 [Amylibacter sp. SFDW26]
MEGLRIYDKNNSDDLGFIEDCYICSAITLPELEQWCVHVAQILDDPPHFIFDLMEVKVRGDAIPISRVVGFSPSLGATDAELDAISGIAVARGTQITGDFDKTISDEAAMRALKENPHIADWFRKLFPFLELEY